MPILRNPDHETFASFLAAGSSHAEADSAARYEPDCGKASRRANSPEICARDEEVQARGRATTGGALTSLMAQVAGRFRHTESDPTARELPRNSSL